MLPRCSQVTQLCLKRCHVPIHQRSLLSLLHPIDQEKEEIRTNKHILKLREIAAACRGKSAQNTRSQTRPSTMMNQAAHRNPNANGTPGGSGSRFYSTNSTSQARSSNRPPFQKKQPKPPSPFEAYSYEKQSPGTRLVYIRDAARADEEIAKLESGPLGFDLEWRPNFIKGRKENPVALVQIASKDVILLIQVSAIGST